MTDALATNGAGGANSDTHTIPSSTKRRKLNTIKCDRCRIDKQRCEPTLRLWPANCHRCIEKDLPCSEGKRAERTDRKPRGPRPAVHKTVKDSTTIELRTTLQHWMFLYRYRKNLSSLAGWYHDLQEDMTEPFGISPSAWRTHISDTDLKASPEHLMRLLDLTFHKLTVILMAKDNARSWTNSWLRILLEEGRAPETFKDKCICEQIAHDPFLRAHVDNQDPLGEFLTLQDLLTTFLSAPDGRICLNVDSGLSCHYACVRQALERYCKASASALTLASETFETLEMIGAAATSQRIGLYHPRIFQDYHFAHRCNLGTIPHGLGQHIKHVDINFAGVAQCSNSDGVNQQDVLGRTPLHVACAQNNNWTAVQCLLDMGANVNLKTMYGSTALHYAAALGHEEVCKRLLRNAEPSYVNEYDEAGRNAGFYANEAGHDEVVKLLDSHAGHLILDELHIIEDIARDRSLDPAAGFLRSQLGISSFTEPNVESAAERVENLQNLHIGEGTSDQHSNDVPSPFGQFVALPSNYTASTTSGKSKWSLRSALAHGAL
ncbi:hypothetical protein EK21DRAFT_113257 [Setomelanomma holmii]|uniref:Zn(2)-C6 fungal-type domain-containing protein n=1 Tax=Setomelanomma holmii TaxID=210430 RepID=A0A9P4H8A9_9PLEO|nr:hypothetical protein EK21DRAFT_113257 [Setomelanomma holmii]